MPAPSDGVVALFNDTSEIWTLISLKYVPNIVRIVSETRAVVPARVRADCKTLSSHRPVGRRHDASFLILYMHSLSNGSHRAWDLHRLHTPKGT